MTTELAKYDAMRKAIEECACVDEAAQIVDQAAALKAYARQAGDTEMWQRCEEIRARAVRRVGELMEAQRESMGLNKGGRPKKKTGSASDPVSDQPKPPTLAEAGIDKHLADDARKQAAKPEEQFEADIAAMKSNAKSAGKKRPAQARAPGRHRMTDAARCQQQAKQGDSRQSRIQKRYNDNLTKMMEATGALQRFNQMVNGEKLTAITKWLGANELTENAATELRQLRSALCEVRDSIGILLNKLPEPVTDVPESEPTTEAAVEMVQ